MNYQRLFNTLDQKNIKRTHLVQDGCVSRSTMHRLVHNLPVSLFTLQLICAYAECDIFDIMDTDDK